jgi:membrane fusion protein, adhesin transport system
MNLRQTLKDKSGSRKPQARYLVQSIRLEETEPPEILSKLSYSISALLVLLVIWAGFTQIEEVARSEGKVVPSGNVQAIQHFEGGIVSEILVRDGEIVKANQTILRLSPVQTKAKLDQIVVRRAALVLSIERNRAIAESRPPEFDKVLDKFSTLKEDQSELYTSEVLSNETQRLVLLRQEDQKSGEVERLQNQVTLQKEEAELLSTELKMRRELFKKGLTTRDGVFAVERQTSKAASTLKDSEDRLSVALESAAESKKRVDEFDSNLRTGSLTLVGELTQQLSEIDENLKGLRDKTNRLEVRAPVDGIIKGLTVNAINAVIRPGDKILELVPTGENMVVEARVSPLDIGHVKIGQNVDIRVTAYDFSTYGALKGSIEKISASTFQSDDGTPYFKATVALEKHYLGDNPKQNVVLPGMVVQANVITGSKSLLDYLMKPINRGFARSFQER